MDELELRRILEALQKRGFLEIEGIGEPSVEALYLGYFSPDQQGESKKRAVYVVSDYYDESGGGSNNNLDYARFDRAALEKLVLDAFESEAKESMLTVPGRRVTFRNYWNCNGEGWEDAEKEEPVNLSLQLVIKDGQPKIRIEYEVRPEAKTSSF